MGLVLKYSTLRCGRVDIKNARNGIMDNKLQSAEEKDLSARTEDLFVISREIFVRVFGKVPRSGLSSSSFIHLLDMAMGEGKREVGHGEGRGWPWRRERGCGRGSDVLDRSGLDRS